MPRINNTMVLAFLNKVLVLRLRCAFTVSLSKSLQKSKYDINHFLLNEYGKCCQKFQMIEK